MLLLGSSCCICLSLRLKKERCIKCLALLLLLRWVTIELLSILTSFCSHNHDYEFLVGKYFFVLLTGIFFKCVNINVVL
jgi:hypothetical protein